jgi:HlyD family secretion protein
LICLKPVAAQSGEDEKMGAEAGHHAVAFAGPSHFSGPVLGALRRHWGWSALVLLAAGAAAAWYWSSRPAGPSYVTVPVSRGRIERTVTATGTVNPVLTITVGSYVSGVIQDISCDFNTVVKKGQLCARIDPRPYQMVVEQDRASLATARAQLQKDQANLAYADLAAQRQADLLAKQATSQDSRDIAVNSLKQAQAQVALDQAAIQQRQAQLDAAQVNLGYTSIVAPVDGIVVSRNVTIGQTVAASFQTPTLFLIATDLSTMQVDTNVSESDIGGIRAGNKARFTVDAFPARTFDGKVTQVRQAPQTVQNVVTYDVLVQVGNKEQLLKPGMTATMRIVTDSRGNVLRVPNQALRYAPGGPSGSGGTRGQPQPGARVWLLEDGQPKAAPVRIGLDDDNHTEITGGLSENAAVIVSEQSRAATGPAASPAPRFP